MGKRGPEGEGDAPTDGTGGEGGRWRGAGAGDRGGGRIRAAGQGRGRGGLCWGGTEEGETEVRVEEARQEGDPRGGESAGGGVGGEGGSALKGDRGRVRAEGTRGRRGFQRERESQLRGGDSRGDRGRVLAGPRLCTPPHPPLRGGGGSAAGRLRGTSPSPRAAPPRWRCLSRSMRWSPGPALGSLLRQRPAPSSPSSSARGRGAVRGQRAPGRGALWAPELAGLRAPRAAPPQHWPAPTPDVTRRCHALPCGAHWELESAEARGRRCCRTPPTEGGGRREKWPLRRGGQGLLTSRTLMKTSGTS